MSIEIINAAHKIDFFVILGIAIMYFTGTLILLFPTLKKLFFEMTNKLQERKKTSRRMKKTESDFLRETRYMLSAAIGQRITAGTFFIATAVLFALTFIMTIRTISPTMALFLSLIVAATPYILLRLRLNYIRNAASGEAEKLIQDILIQYRIAGFSIEGALEKVIANNKGLIVSKPLLYQMLQTIRSTRNKQEIRDTTDMFSHTIGTNWAKMLSHNIYSSSVNNINVSLSLEDILIQLREARSLSEERKRINAESGRMFWMIPLSYLGTVIIATSMMGMTFNKFIANQFGTAIGVIFFIIIVVLTVISYMLISMTKQKKFDF